MKVDPPLLVEPGAWAGSSMEASLVSKLMACLGTYQPRATDRRGLAAGLRAARGYASDGLTATQATVLEADHAIYAATRTYVVQVGAPNLPTKDSWKHLMAWIKDARSADAAATRPQLADAQQRQLTLEQPQQLLITTAEPAPTQATGDGCVRDLPVGLHGGERRDAPPRRGQRCGPHNPALQADSEHRDGRRP